MRFVSKNISSKFIYFKATLHNYKRDSSDSMNQWDILHMSTIAEAVRCCQNEASK